MGDGDMHSHSKCFLVLLDLKVFRQSYGQVHFWAKNISPRIGDFKLRLSYLIIFHGIMSNLHQEEYPVFFTREVFYDLSNLALHFIQIYEIRTSRNFQCPKILVANEAE